MNTENKTILYDGDCPMCKVVIDKIDNSSQKGKFDLKDITKEQLPENLTKEQVMKEIHVIDSEGKVFKNSEAILKILEEYPKWRFLSKIGGLPIIKQLLPIGYKFFAANRHFIFGGASRIFYLKIILVLGLISGLLLSAKLWSGGRFFPFSPVFSNLPTIFPYIWSKYYIIQLILLLLILIFPKPKKLIFLSLGISIFFVLFDQSRLQPWFYQYFFMLATLGIFSWNYVDTEKQHAVLNTVRLIVASIYFYSGLQKINIVFMSSVFPWMMEPITKFLPASLQIYPLYFCILVPFVEMGIGIGLVTKRFRNYAVIAAILMHGFILFSLGPLGHNWNSVVWPWNIAMMLFDLVLFWKTTDVSFKDILWTRNFTFQRVVLVLFLIMPMFSFLNLWDSYLSSALYSGNTNNARIFISDSVKQKLPSEVQTHVIQTITGENELDFYMWSFEELNVPAYPETRVYKDIARDICSFATHEDEVRLVVLGKPTVFNRDIEAMYNCSNL